MSRLAGAALQGEPYRPLAQVLGEIDAVTAEETNGARGGVLSRRAPDGAVARPKAGPKRRAKAR